MKNLVALALILTCFVFTTLMVGCGPSNINKRQKIRKSRKPVHKNTLGITKSNPLKATKDDNTLRPMSIREALARTNENEANSEQKKIDEFLAQVDNESGPHASLEQVPRGTFKLSQIISITSKPTKGSRTLTSATVSGDNSDLSSLKFVNKKLLIEELPSFDSDKTHGKENTTSGEIILASQFKVKKNSGIDFTKEHLFYFRTQVRNGDVVYTVIPISESPNKKVASPLRLLKPEFENTGSKAFEGNDGPEKGLKVYVRLAAASKEEIRLIVDMLADDSTVIRSTTLVYKLLSAAHLVNQ